MSAAFLLVVFATSPGPEAGPTGDPQMHKGTVVSAGGGRLVIKDKSGKEQSFTVDPVTRVTVHGKPGKLEDLQDTMPVHVATDATGKVLAVSTVDMEKGRRIVSLSNELTNGRSTSGR